MKILLVYPEYPQNTFWGFEHALKFVAKKAGFPPLGLLTIAAMLPKDWELKLVDMNIEPLDYRDILWADYVFISAMIAQTQSAKEIIVRCNKLGVKVVAGGPVFTSGHENFAGVEHFVLGEAEAVLPQFLEGLHLGQAKRVYSSKELPELIQTPVPRWDLIDVKKYASLSMQVSRGCPWNCNFCDIIATMGRRSRLKTPDQVANELSAIYATGFRGSVMVVDDNFIGDKRRIRQILIRLASWQEEHDFPFALSTEVSVDVADKDYLIELMVEAGFTMVFVGLESTCKESLKECGKIQNVNRDLGEVVRKLVGNGLMVYAGFMLGFDHDPPTIFDDLLKFLRKSSVCVAMVSPLNALPNTPLHERLEQEGRLLGQSSGDNTDGTTNFKPIMGMDVLCQGYKLVVRRIYSPREYYQRILNILKEYKAPDIKAKIRLGDFMAFLRSIWYLGIFSSWQVRWYYWKAIFVSFFKNRGAFPKIVVMLIYGDHFRKVAEAIDKS